MLPFSLKFAAFNVFFPLVCLLGIAVAVALVFILISRMMTAARGRPFDPASAGWAIIYLVVVVLFVAVPVIQGMASAAAVHHAATLYPEVSHVAWLGIGIACSAPHSLLMIRHSPAASGLLLAVQGGLFTLFFAQPEWIGGRAAALGVWVAGG